MFENNQLKSKVHNIFEYLHKNPETSWNEVETTAYIKKLLKPIGYKIEEFTDHTGLVATIGSGAPVVALRADIDALWQEVDGVYQANHSCGHDAHMAIVLGVAMLFEKSIDSLTGTVKLIFQPAEETGTGALKLVEKGIAKDIDYLYGVHLRPIQELEYGNASAGISHGAGTLLKGRISGHDTHGARPHLGVNVIEVGTELIQKCNHIHVDPLVPHSLKVTSFVADGGSHNIIPGSADFSIDIRAQTNEVIKELELRVRKAIKSIQDYYHIDIDLKTVTHFPAAIIDPEAKELLRTSIAQVLGLDNTRDTIITTGGDDFHYYKIETPSIKAIMLGLGCDLEPGLHHAKMTFNHDSLIDGVLILYHTIKNTFKNHSKNK